MFGTDRQGRPSPILPISSPTWRHDQSRRLAICKLRTPTTSVAPMRLSVIFLRPLHPRRPQHRSWAEIEQNTLSSVQEEGTVAVGYLNWTHSLLLKT